MKKFLVVTSFFSLFFVLGERVEAKSATVTGIVGGDLLYEMTASGFADRWVYGLRDNPTYSVGYNAFIYNHSTGEPIIDGASIPLGTVLRFESALGDVSYTGTGSSIDTPYGVWNAGAAFPDGPTYTYSCSMGTCRGAQCSEKFYTTLIGNIGLGYRVFIPFSVNPPTPSISRDSASQAKLNCSANICTVISSGTISTDFIFPATYAKFWYEYFSWGSYAGCHTPWSEIPMRLAGPYVCSFMCLFPPATETDTFPVPQSTISFNLTAVSNNNPPSIPAVTPQPFNGNTNTAYPFTFTSTDPDNDQIAYEVDWNNDSLPDEGTPFVSSSTSQSLSNPVAQWLIAGTYSFKVRAKDNQGGVSSWTTPSVTLTTIVNGVCGLASGLSFDTLDITNLALCASGTQTNFLPTGTGWTWGCNGSGGGTSTLPNACTATTKTYTLSAVKNLGPSAAGTIIDTTPTAMSIDSAIPRNTESVPYNSSRTLRANPTSSSISWSGCASVSGNDCIVNNIIADKTVTATFTRLPEPGICGSSNTQSFETLNAGSSGLCSSGAVSGFSLSGTTYSWDCNGSFGSAINVSCSASQIRDYNWKEVRP